MQDMGVQPKYKEQPTDTDLRRRPRHAPADPRHRCARRARRGRSLLSRLHARSTTLEWGMEGAVRRDLPASTRTRRSISSSSAGASSDSISIATSATVWTVPATARSTSGPWIADQRRRRHELDAGGGADQRSHPRPSPTEKFSTPSPTASARCPLWGAGPRRRSLGDYCVCAGRFSSARQPRNRWCRRTSWTPLRDNKISWLTHPSTFVRRFRAARSARARLAALHERQTCARSSA